MEGPRPKGFWSDLEGPDAGRAFKHLEAGRKYYVIQGFLDYDLFFHEADETWTFLGCSFFPFEDALCLFISFDGEQEWQFRMEWRTGLQREVLERLEEYLAPLPAGQGGAEPIAGTEVWTRS